VNLEQFQAFLSDTRHTKDDLVTMRANVLVKNDVAFVHAAEAALDKRFPTWRSVIARRGGSKPTDVEFLGHKEHCDSEKDAYIWLIERFVQHYPKPFQELDWETLFVAKGPRALYFAKSVRRLFGVDRDDLASDQNKWHRLDNGWYAKLLLSEAQKLTLLHKFGSVAHLRFGVDWDWNGQGRARPQLSGDELLRELEEDGWSTPNPFGPHHGV